jgi:hypothetical protein
LLHILDNNAKLQVVTCVSHTFLFEFNNLLENLTELEEVTYLHFLVYYEGERLASVLSHATPSQRLYVYREAHQNLFKS